MNRVARNATANAHSPPQTKNKAHSVPGACRRQDQKREMKSAGSESAMESALLVRRVRRDGGAIRARLNDGAASSRG